MTSWLHLSDWPSSTMSRDERTWNATGIYWQFVCFEVQIIELWEFFISSCDYIWTSKHWPLSFRSCQDAGGQISVSTNHMWCTLTTCMFYSDESKSPILNISASFKQHHRAFMNLRSESERYMWEKHHKNSGLREKHNLKWDPRLESEAIYVNSAGIQVKRNFL